MRATKSLLALCLAAIGCAYGQSNTLTVEIGSRSGSTDPVKAAVTARAKKIAALTDGAKRRLMAKYPGRQISFPTRVKVTRNGILVATRSVRGNGPITLQFNTAAGFTFPSAYQTFLQNIFNTTQSELTRLFGQPLQAGTILVSNYDATIDDRDAVAGGIYLPNNGSNVQEIRFPLYENGSVIDLETTTVNFVHTLLLAYQGTSPYAYDAFEEGLARAVTATVARENGIQTTLGLSPAVVEAVLSSTYDVQGSYDWDNQRALGGPVFIAPNLLSQTTVPTGTDGGAYLLRYRMAGSAWAKVLIEYPLFAAQLNTLVAATPSLTTNVAGLVNAAQTVLNSDNPSSPTVEGMSFANWFARQYILDTNLSAGSKVLVEVVPETPDDTTDFGLFDVETTYFATDSAGNETFPNPNGGVAYPLFLDNAYNRFSPSAQDDVMAFDLGYGSVTPNFLASYNGGLIYRVAIDIPVNDQVTRVFVPAGGVSTGSNSTTNEVYGTVSGDDPPAGQSEDVKIYVGNDLVTDAPVVNGAFGVNILSQFDAEYSIARQIEAQVWVTNPGGGSTMILDRLVDKPATGLLADGSQIGLALDLRVGGDGSYDLPLTAGLNAIGFPIDPYSSYAPGVLGESPSQLLVSRYDGLTGKYILNPSVEPFKIGHGYFAEVPTATTALIPGRSAANTVSSVALEPGWNLVSCPLPQVVQGTQVLVYHANDLTTTINFNDASSAGTLLGNTFFKFVPGANDPAAGYPTTGSFTAATEFDPGQAYYVQCLAPEGLVLDFVPNSLTASVKKRVVAAPLIPITWQMNVQIKGTAGDAADCVIGMAPGATAAYNSRLDIGLPPSVGGLQIVSQNSQARYRDFRAPSTSVIYTLAVSNLKAGEPYNMTFLGQAGNAPRMTLRNQSGVTVNMPRNGHYYFVPSSTTQTFTLTVMGVGQ